MTSRPFRLLLASRAASALATGLASVVILWVASPSGPAALALIGLAMTLPRLAALVAGVLIDRMDRRRLLALVEGGRGLTALALARAAWLPHPPLVVLAGSTALLALGSSLFGPLVSAWMPQVVPPAELTAANGLQQGVWQGASLAGYVAGGGALVLLGAGGGLMAAAALLAAALALALAVPRAGGRPAPADTSFAHEAAAGLHAVAKHPALRVLVPAALVFNLLFAPLTVGLVLLARQWHLGPTGYVALEGAWAAGNLAGGVAASRWRLLPADLARYAVLGGLPLVAGGMLGWPPAALAALLAAGIGNLLLNASALTLVQQSTPPELRGRVLGVLFALMGAAAPLGIALWGLAARLLPSAAVLVIPGTASLLAALLAAMPAGRRILEVGPAAGPSPPPSS